MTFGYSNGEPIVRLEIQNDKGEWVELLAYVDSGASYSVFYSDYAKVLGIDALSGRTLWLMVGDGTKIKVYVHKIRVKFAGKEFVAEIGFSDDLKIGMNLVGQHSFFENFTFCFKTWKQELEVVPK